VSRFALGLFLGSLFASVGVLGTLSVAKANNVKLQLPENLEVLERLKMPKDIRLPEELRLPDDIKVPKGLELPEGFRLPSIGRDKPVVVYLDREGGRVQAGRDDARQRKSGVVQRQDMTHVDLPAYTKSDRSWQKFTTCVEQQFSDFDVIVVDERPEGDDYMTVMVGGNPKAFGFEKTVGGIAPYDGSVLRNAIVFVFQTPHRTERQMCETAAHEIGHALGLDHTRLCSDVMSYERCGPKTFEAEPVACGEWGDRTCAHGEQTQSSWERLAGQVGTRDDDHMH
jgi:hypothetical protein